MAAPTQVDHLVVATPDLESAVDELEQRLGVRTSPGGSHGRWITPEESLSFFSSDAGSELKIDEDAGHGAVEKRRGG